MLDYVIPVQTTPSVTVFQTVPNGSSEYVTLTIVGLLTTEVITVDVPRVANPQPSNDAHWTPLYQDDVEQSLRSGNNSITVPTRLIVRLKKLDSGSNPFGIRRS